MATFVELDGVTYTLPGTGGVGRFPETTRWFVAVTDKLNQVSTTASSVIDVVVDHGAVGDGTTDDTAAIQEAFDAQLESGGMIYIPPGTYRITSQIYVPLLRGGVVYGAGMWKSIIQPDGMAGVNVFKLSNCDKMMFRDFQIRGDIADPPRSLIQFYRDTSGAILDRASSNNIFENVRFGGDTEGDHVYGVTTEGTDQNNDQHMFLQCQFDNASTAGFYQPNGQVKHCKFIGCVFTGGEYGVLGRCSGSWITCQFANHSEGAFGGTNVTEGHLVMNCGIESTARFFHWTGGATDNPDPRTFINNRFSGNEQHADLRMFHFRCSGPYVIEGNILGQNGNDAGGHIYINTGGAHASLKVTNNIFDAIGSDTYESIQGAAGGAVGALGVIDVEYRNNTYRTSGSVEIKTDGQRSVTTSTYDVKPQHNGWTLYCNRAGIITLNPQSGISKGFRIHVVDASGNASTYPIKFTPFTNGTDVHTIDGGLTTKQIIYTDYGSCTLVFDGTKWNSVGGLI